MANDQPRFRIEVTPKPGVVGDQAIRSLRALLKVLVRSYGLRCVSVQQIKPEEKL